jgi:uncharacterized protein YeaO (DUF488 family)
MAAKRAGDIRIKRAYDPSASADGTRILVDRLWPRGVSKETLAIERWMKEIGPSGELRRWFGHDPERWDEFRRRYTAELANQSELLAELRDTARQGPLTLVYAARDDAHNNAVALRDVLTRAKPGARRTSKRGRISARKA